VGKSCKIVGGIIKLSTPKFTSVGCHMHVTGTVLFQYEQKLIIISMKTHQSLPPFKLNVPFRSGRFGSGPGPTLRSRSNSGWPWPFLLGSGPPIFDPDTRTFGVGPGRPPGQGPPTLTVDSLFSERDLTNKCKWSVHAALYNGLKFLSVFSPLITSSLCCMLLSRVNK
jgi:hypothetical protein